MSRKPGSMYRTTHGQPHTRKEYTGGIPSSRISQYEMGNRRDKFPIQLNLHVDEALQIRHNCLESARISANRVMDKTVGTANYRIRIRVFPHVILRENKQATGAGADRVSQGMRASYGKNVSTAARVKPNQIIMTVETTKPYFAQAKKALRKAGMKIASPFTIKIERGAELVM